MENYLKKESEVSSIGGMARVVETKNDFFSCPPWIDANVWGDYRKQYISASQTQAELVQLDLELSDSCNYKCIECPISDDITNRTINNIDDEVALKIIRDASNAGCKALKLNYINEPLLNPKRLIRIAKQAQEIGIIDIYFTTNGSMLTEDVSKSLIEARVFSRIQVSLDAFTSETYDKVRRGGSLKKVIKNIDTFIKLRSQSQIEWPKLRVSFLSLPENAHESQKFVEFWQERVDAVALQSSVLKPKSVREDISSYSEQRDVFCPNPFRQLVVRADMSVLPCCSFWGTELQIGEYSDQFTLMDAFKSKAMSTIQESFLTGKISEACQSCLKSCDPDLSN